MSENGLGSTEEKVSLGEVLISGEQGLGMIKQIEALFHLLNEVGIPMKHHDQVMRSMMWLKQMHDGIMKTLPKDVIERERKKEALKNAPTIPADAPAAPQEAPAVAQ